MQIRPGKTRSLIGGILVLVIMVLGLVMMTAGYKSMEGFGGPGGLGAPTGIISIFMIVWVLFGLIGAGASFYNAFSEKGIPLYEVKMQNQNGEESKFCPQCGKPIDSSDRFCKHCGSELK